MAQTLTQKQTLTQRMAELDADAAAEDAALWGNVASSSSLVQSPKFQQLVAILHENPLLVAPALQWLMEKRAALSLAQLQVLYTPEQLEAMAKQAK